MKKVLFFDLRELLEPRVMTTRKAWMLLILAIVLIAAACYFLVEACYGLGEDMGIRSYFIAVILAAAATSVPDTMLSIKDSMEGEYDDAVANALGSNIFDICVCLGLPLLLYSLFTGNTINVGSQDESSVAELRMLLLLMTAIIFLLFLFGRGLGKIKAWTFLFMYGFFVYYIIARAYEDAWAVAFGKFLQGMLRAITFA